MKPLLPLALVLPLATASLGAQSLDQEQNNAAVCMINLNTPDLAQSFRPGIDNVAGVGIFFFPGIGSSSLVTMELWDALPNAGGNLLASGSAVGSPGTWVDVLWPQVPVTIGSTYYMVFHSSGSTLCVAGDATDPYADGQVYANNGYSGFPDFDYTFHTWAISTPQLAVSTPQAGGFMDVTVERLSPGSSFVFVMSSLGPGPTNTPFGIVEVTPPFRLSPSLPEIDGSFDWTSTVPSGAAGSTFYMQVVEFEQGGVVELSNALALPVS